MKNPELLNLLPPQERDYSILEAKGLTQKTLSAKFFLQRKYDPNGVLAEYHRRQLLLKAFFTPTNLGSQQPDNSLPEVTNG